MMTKKVVQFKNIALLTTYILTLLPKTVFGLDARLNLGFFIERSTRIDFFMMYYTNAISFLILAYCLHYPRGLDKRVTRLILTTTGLDLVHLLLYAKQDFGVVKIGTAILIVVLYDLYNKRYATH